MTVALATQASQVWPKATARALVMMAGPASGPSNTFRSYHATPLRIASIQNVQPATTPTKPHPPSQPTVSPQQPTKATDLEIGHLKPSYVMDHHIYNHEDLDSIDILHYKPKTFTDRLAWLMVKMMRGGFDLATRYPSKRNFPLLEGRGKEVVKTSTQARLKHEQQRQRQQSTQQITDKIDNSANDSLVDTAQSSTSLPPAMALDEMRAKGLSFTPSQWLQRFVFLESVAGVPGMVGATARHLHSLRLLRRDGGWIHELLQDAENERMHLLSFLKISQPGWRMRGLLVVTQGIFYNFLFLLYLASPRLVHRFVGILEEEAVKTYTQVLEDLDEGRLPEWEQLPAPEIAIEYWKLGQDAKMGDLLKVIRADEAGHRFIHHSFANLETEDTNPFSVASPAPKMIGSKLSLERDEALEYIRKAQQQQQQQSRKQA